MSRFVHYNRGVPFSVGQLKEFAALVGQWLDMATSNQRQAQADGRPPTPAYSYYQAVPETYSARAKADLFVLLRQKEDYGFSRLPDDVLSLFMRSYFPKLNIHYIFSPALLYGVIWARALEHRDSFRFLWTERQEDNYALKSKSPEAGADDELEFVWPYVLREMQPLKKMLNDISNVWEGDPRIAKLSEMMIILGNEMWDTGLETKIDDGQVDAYYELDRRARLLANQFDWSQMTLDEARAVATFMDEQGGKYENIVKAAGLLYQADHARLIYTGSRYVPATFSMSVEEAEQRKFVNRLQVIRNRVSESIWGYFLGWWTLMNAVEDPEIQKKFAKAEPKTFLLPDRPRPRGGSRKPLPVPNIKDQSDGGSRTEDPQGNIKSSDQQGTSKDLG
ncbi:MAG: hypothetical protein M1831_001127 [Alyxoria varia]|nr:MAG: hypothetical protein M1831_001127 [Alyxoria varia]